MALQEVKPLGGTHVVSVGVDPTTGKYYPVPVNPTTGQLITDAAIASAFMDRLKATDPISYQVAEGYGFEVSGTTADASVTSTQTSFANTTPTFLLDVPEGITVIPLFMGLAQTGTVAGGDIIVLMEKDNALRHSTGGTPVTPVNSRPRHARVASGRFYTNPTAIAGFGVRMLGQRVAPDVSPAEGVINEIVWTPAGALDYIDGPGAWLVFTYAGTTGPTWLWEFKWLEVATSLLPALTV